MSAFAPATAGPQPAPETLGFMVGQLEKSMMKTKVRRSMGVPVKICVSEGNARLSGAALTATAARLDHAH